MAVRIRLARVGGKQKPFYRVVAQDKDRARNGLYLELLGTFDPRKKEGAQFKKERVAYWLSKGALATERVSKLWKQSQIVK